MDADLILTGGRIWPVGGVDRPGAVAVARGRILAVGDEDDVLWCRGPGTEIVDLPGTTCLPGLCDSHIHALHYGVGLDRIRLEGRGPEGILRAVRERVEATGPEAWIHGFGWDPAGLPDDILLAPDLDAAGEGRPVVLWSRDFHSIRASRAALEAACIGRDTPDPAGGAILRDVGGEPTGLLREAATDRIVEALPRPTHEEAEAAIEAVTRELHGKGVTAIHEMASHWPHDVYGRLHGVGRLRLRTLLMSRVETAADLDALEGPSGHGDDTFRRGGVKVFADGTLGSRTAWMLEPYADRPGHRGLETTPAGELREIARRAAGRGLAMTIHAIGDGAVRAALDAVAAAREIDGGRLRHRLEHVQCYAEEDLPRFAALDVHVAVQPSHMMDDRETAARAWGEARAARCHAYRSLREAGVRLSFGSDAPVTEPDPLLAIRLAVHRTEGATEPFHPEQALSIEEAVEAATAGSEIRPGVRADLAVLSTDLRRGPEALRDAACVLTVYDGEIVHREPRR